MTAYPDHKLCWIRETIINKFGFLLDQGFCIVSVMFTAQGTEDWQVVMLSRDCFIRVRCDRGRITLGFSKMELLHNRVGFFDFDIMLELSVKWDESRKVLGRKGKTEERQIDEKAGLLRKYSDELFQQFDVLSSFILDRLWLISEPNQNGRLSMDNRPFSFNLQIQQ